MHAPAGTRRPDDGDGGRPGAPGSAGRRAAGGTGTRRTAPRPDRHRRRLGATDALPRLFKVFGGIVAPTTLLTGLLFYFGRSRAAGYYRYFRVNSTVLDLTTNDYLFAGVDGLFVPIAVACLLALVCLWLNRLLLTRVPRQARRRAVRVLVPAAGLIGAVLVALAFADLFTEGDVFGRQLRHRRDLPGGRRDHGRLRRPAAPPVLPRAGTRPGGVAGDRAGRVGRGLPAGEHRPVLGGRRPTRSASARGARSRSTARCRACPRPSSTARRA